MEAVPEDGVAAKPEAPMSKSVTMAPMNTAPSYNLPPRNSKTEVLVKARKEEQCSLHVISAGSGGVDEMKEYVDEREVQWALLRFEIGSGAFRRQHALFFHMNGRHCSAVRRGKANEFTTEALHILRGRGNHNFHASVEVTTNEEVTKDLLLGKISSSVIVDHGDHSAQWIMEEYERQIKENATRPPPVPSGSEKESSEGGRLIPGNKQYSKLFCTGREALKAVSEPLGLWNWVLVGPDDKDLPLIDGGEGSLDEMVEALQAHEVEVLFGLLRLGFGTGRLRRTKHIFIHTVGPRVGAVKRGQLSSMRPKIQEAMRLEQCATVTCVIESMGVEGLTIDEVIDKVRRAAIVDDQDLGKDEGTRSAFSVAAFRSALEEEKKIIAEKAADQKQPKAKIEKIEVKWKTSEAVELIHRPGGPLNWALFGYEAKNQQKVIAMQSPLMPNPRATVVATGQFSGWRRKDQACIAFDVMRYAVHESEGKVTLVVKRSGDLSQRVLVDYRTDPGSACPGDGEDDPGDYVEAFGTLEFLPEETAKEIEVEIIDDDEYEDDEEFYVVLHGAQCPEGGTAQLEKGKSTATVLIIDDDDPGWLQFASDVFIEVVPDTMIDGLVTVVVERMEGCKGAISCSYRTEDDTAKAGNDYVAASGVLEFGASQMTATVEVNIKSRARYEAHDLFRIVLAEPVGGTRFCKEKDDGPLTISQVVAITSFAPSEPSTPRGEGGEDVLTTIDSFWSEPGKAPFKPVQAPKPGASPDSFESRPKTNLLMPPAGGEAPPPPSPEPDATPNADKRVAAEADSPEVTAGRLSKRLSMLSADLDAAEEPRASESEQRQRYGEKVLNPILGSLVEACLSGQPSDTRDFMIRWLTARAAGAPMPMADASARQLPREAYVEASISPLLGPLAAEVLGVLPPDPVPMMIQHLSRGPGDGSSVPAALLNSRPDRTLSDFVKADSVRPEAAPASFEDSRVQKQMALPRLTGALLKQTRPGIFQRWQMRHIEIGPTGRLSWWHSPNMAAAKDPAAGYVELKDLTVQRGKGSVFSITAAGERAISFDANVGKTSGWPGATSNGNAVTHKLTAANWAKIIEYEVNRINRGGARPPAMSGVSEPDVK